MNSISKKQKVMRVLQGLVVSNKPEKTAVVLVERKIKHAVTGKYVRRSSKIHAHDENKLCKEGDVVRIVEGRPMSRMKRWVVIEVVGHSNI